MRKIAGLLFLVWILFAGADSLYSQKIPLKHYTVNDGLIASQVHTIFQDSRGYLWFGTVGGVSRFDGISFHNISKIGSAIFHNIYSILEDRKGRLWFCSAGNGVVCMQGEKISAYGTENGLPATTISTAAEDQGGNLWFGTSKGICKFSRGGFIPLFPAHSKFGSEVLAIQPGRGGTLWLGGDGGLECLRGGRTVTYGTSSGPAGKRVQALAMDQGGNLWVGMSQGLDYMQGDKITSYTVKDGLAGNDITDIMIARDGTVWLATTSGISRYASGKFTNILPREGLPNETIRSIFQDREGNIWFSTRGGVYRILSFDIVNLTTYEGLPNNQIWSIAEGKNRETWIGTNKGLSRLSGGTIRNFSTRDGLPSDRIYALLTDRGGKLWIGTSRGISVYSKGTFKNYSTSSTPQGLISNLVLSFTESRSGVIWIATSRGISLFKKNAFSPPPFKEKVGAVHSIIERNNGEFWFSTTWTLNRIAGDHLQVIPLPDEPSSKIIHFIYEDSKSRLWMGTRGGLYFRENGTFYPVTTQDGSTYDKCQFAIEGPAGHLWFGTPRGISRYDGKTFSSYTSRDGLVYDELVEGACLLDSRGFLWFGSHNGLSRFNPSSRPQGALPELPAYITRLRYLDGNIPLGQSISLEYHQNHLRFDFIGLYFYAPEKVTYRYRIKELDPRWSETNLRSVEYSYLPPGDYTFQVSAELPGGTRGKKPAEITFTISPPFWRTWWFVHIALAAFAVLSYLVINFSKKYLVLLAFWRKKQYLGHYRLLETIGSGGMGTVYLAENLMDKSRFVALKVLRDEVSGDEEQRKRFVNEALTIDQIRHPNIVKIYERGEHNQRLYIAMEFLDGINLGEKLKEDRSIPLDQCLAIARQLAGALQKIHEKGIIHRDLKPENVMILETPDAPITVKLLDFGLAKLHFQTRITETGELLGTIHYMSPEQFRRGEITFAHDIYSLGVMFYEMFTGEKPFHGETEHDILVKILEEYPPPPRQHRPDLPVHIDQLVTAMMAKDQNQRPTGREVIQRLEARHGGA